MTLVGYARVSTSDQDPALQQSALREAGCERIYVEHASGANPNRPELQAALDYLRDGDTLVVWKLDRLGRSLPHLIDTVTGLRDRGIGFRSITEGMDTSGALGELLFHIFGAFAQFERALIRERTLAGLAAARANGRVGGRRKSLTPRKAALAQSMYDERTEAGERAHTVAQIAAEVGCARTTVYRYLEPQKAV